MNYLDQQRYLKQSRMNAISSVLALLVMAAVSVLLSPSESESIGTIIVFGTVTIALAVCFCYLPDYLHLTVNPQKRSSWAIKVRWRIIGAVLILGLALAGNPRSWMEVLIAVAGMGVANLLAKAWRLRLTAIFLWVCDSALLAALLLFGRLDPFLGAILLAAALHLAVAGSDDHPYLWAAITVVASWMVLWVLWERHGGNPRIYIAYAGLVLVSGRATSWLVARAREQNAKNVAAAVRELKDFTGYSSERVRQLWASSNQELAQNWQKAAIAPDDRETLAAWYRDNSELYLFAISGYNLEYKRIRSNMNVLAMARGACLDYGAGNGEIILELARRGHRATYYDVDGVTMRFARRRAEVQRLNVEFLHDKPALASSAGRHAFDTIFSFDVLEHLPDLPGELDFLSSLLAAGGVFVFDVPAGSTKAHPMHLNHNLNVFAHMQAKGMADERGLALRLPFKKEEKYVYRKPQPSSEAAGRQDASDVS